MESINNAVFTLQMSDRGFINKLLINDDADSMNWVVDPAYLEEAGYRDEEKCFGHFDVKAGGKEYGSMSVQPLLARTGANGGELSLVYAFDRFDVRIAYDLESDEASLRWQISLHNRGSEELAVDEFHIWSALAYIMYRDPDVRRNISKSCAVFPSISKDFSKIAAVRRSGQGPHLGVYAVKGVTRSAGTYCRFENNFFKDVSPSLDGILFHKLVLAGAGTGDPRAAASDWIYCPGGAESLVLQAGGTAEWEYMLLPFADKRQFYENGLRLGHPLVEYSPAAVAGGTFQALFRLPEARKLRAVWVESSEGGQLLRADAAGLVKRTDNGAFELVVPMAEPGERKLVFELDNGKTDFVVFNVMEPVKEIIEARTDYICRNLYQDENAEAPHAFLPLSNQGESLGKLNLVLMKNLMGDCDADQVRKVENSAVFYMKTKWFENGDFYRPAKLYGDGGFYRIIDFDYVAHVYYLLSKFQAGRLSHARMIKRCWIANK